MNLPCVDCRAKCCTSAGGWRDVWINGQRVPFVDGRCPYLTDENRCGIWGSKEQAGCKSFDCSAPEWLSFRQRNPDVAALLEAQAPFTSGRS